MLKRCARLSQIEYEKKKKTFHDLHTRVHDFLEKGKT